jgi:hypothetical protein
MPWQQRQQAHKQREENGYAGMEPNLSETRWDQHWGNHRSGARLWWKRQLAIVSRNQKALAMWIQHTLSNQTVQVHVVGTLKTKVSSADVINSLVVDHEGAIGVLKGGVGGKDGIVWLYDGCSGLGCWVHAEFQFDLLTEVNWETFHEESTKARSSSTTERVEDKETLQARAVVGNLANLIQNLVNQLLSNSVMSTGIVVWGILLASDHLFWVEQAAVGTSADLVDDVGLEITIDSAGDIFALTWQGITRK